MQAYIHLNINGDIFQIKYANNYHKNPTCMLMIRKLFSQMHIILTNNEHWNTHGARLLVTKISSTSDC